ncbi:uncharacterized protein JN550_009823 [Neoarthrinium moseri]|uniref:uncharacterized protein n=1 Tax=Neoarthrinium moseri TaxID=1658444 RepID=UPI001FDBE7CF|nr:uncharacterized protein JN550_009823 [Neoarthrinium moseri]KAI1863087.1 hypothetical protein JN550_009823 [Neoarthrinium moseri]
MGSPTTTGGVTGFQFITSINTITRDDETRRKVRSHARRQKLSNEPSSQPPATKSTSQKERTSKFRLGARASGSAKKQSQPKSRSPQEESSTSSPDSLVEEVKNEGRDGWHTEMITEEFGFTVAPELQNFSVLPIRTTPLTDNLFKWMICVCLSPQEKFVQRWFNRCGAPSYFNTYHSSFLSLSHAMNPQGNWFDFITVDPAMTHGFMGLVAAMHNALAEWDDMTSIDFHRYETIKYINKRLNMEGRHDTTVSDGVIVAVSLLVQIEAFIGSLSSARAHLMGLKKMVELRGGLRHGFGHSPLLQRALAWADFAYATASQTPLSFPFIPQLADPLGIQDRFLSRSTMLNAAASADPGAGLVIQNREILEIFELLYSTTRAVNGFEFNKLESLRTERGQMSDSMYLTDYRLCILEETIRSRERSRYESASMISTSPVSAPDDQLVTAYKNPKDLSDSLVYASHLFLHMALRGQPPLARAHKLPLEGLMASLYEPLAASGLLIDSTPSPSLTFASQSPETQASAGTSLDSWPSPVNDKPDESTHTSALPRKDDRDDLHEDLLLWVLFVGSCVQIRPSPILDGFESMPDHRAFFLGALRQHCIARNILDRDVLLSKLRDLIWLDSWCEKQLDVIWARIGNELGV